MRILLDLNVVLDLFLQRQPWASDAEKVWRLVREDLIEASFSSASFPALFYLIRKQRGTSFAHLAVAACLTDLTIATVHSATIGAAAAAAGPGPDFEDNIQIVCAIEARLDAIVTRDIKGFAASPIPALSPAELLAKIATTPDHDPLPG